MIHCSMKDTEIDDGQPQNKIQVEKGVEKKHTQELVNHKAVN